MAQPENIPQRMIKSTRLLSQHYKVSIMVVVCAIISIAFFGYLGYRLDVYFETYPLVFIIGILISFPCSQILIIKWIKGRYVPSQYD